MVETFVIGAISVEEDNEQRFDPRIAINGTRSVVHHRHFLFLLWRFCAIETLVLSIEPPSCKGFFNVIFIDMILFLLFFINIIIYCCKKTNRPSIMGIITQHFLKNWRNRKFPPIFKRSTLFKSRLNSFANLDIPVIGLFGTQVLHNIGYTVAMCFDKLLFLIIQFAKIFLN